MSARVPQERKAVLLSISMPHDLAELFTEEAGGTGYGKRSEMFRKMLMAWVESRHDREGTQARLQSQLNTARGRAQAAEARLQRIREAGGWRE